MDSIFINEKHQIEFEEKGYLKLDNTFLNGSDIKELVDFHSTSGIMKSSTNGFEVSLENTNKNLVIEMMELIHNIALPRINKLFKNNKSFIATFLGKNNNKNGIVLPHQDWTFVENEIENYSFSCWIPLVDVDIRNGCMAMIKGSHTFLNVIRPSPAAKIVSPLSPHLYSLIPYLEPIPMKAGELLIFNNKILHASFPNTTNRYRNAIAIVFTQSDAAFRHYYLKPKTNNVLLKYEVDIDFFAKYDDKILFKMYQEDKIINDYKILDEIEYNVDMISKKELETKLYDTENKYDATLEEYSKLLLPGQNKFSYTERLNNFIKKINPFSN
jgi:ectoine hydroxylase-related dioxygenase (phytanoyl-CoA dioxygenase family)